MLINPTPLPSQTLVTRRHVDYSFFRFSHRRVAFLPIVSFPRFADKFRPFSRNHFGAHCSSLRFTDVTQICMNASVRRIDSFEPLKNAIFQRSESGRRLLLVYVLPTAGGILAPDGCQQPWPSTNANTSRICESRSTVLLHPTSAAESSDKYLSAGPLAKPSKDSPPAASAKDREPFDGGDPDLRITEAISVRLLATG